MHIGCLGGHFDEEYTPSEYIRRGANASFSSIKPPSRRNTASIAAASRSSSPRTSSDPCSTTAARKASRCSDAQRGASAIVSRHNIGGFPLRSSTLSKEVEVEDAISCSFHLLGPAASSGG